MPIIGFHHDPSGDDSVYFVTPQDRPKELRRIRQLLILAALVGMFSAGANALLMLDVYNTTQVLKVRGEEIVKDPAVLSVIKAEAPGLLEDLAKKRQEPPPEAVKVEQAAEMGLDVLRMSVMLSGNLMLLMMALTFYFPLKYVLLYRRAGRGEPEVIRLIRATVWAQVAVELFKNFNLMLLNAESKVVDLPNSPSLTLLIAAWILLHIRRAHVREFFSDYRVLPAPPEVVAAWEASQASGEAPVTLDP